MITKIALTLLLIGVFTADLSAHEFYISITTIKHQPQAQKLSIQVRIFVNDLEECIYQEQGIRLGLWKNAPIENAEAYVAEYVCSRLAISINDEAIPLNFIDLKVESAEIMEDHLIICQLEAFDVPDIDTIKIYNGLLTEAFDSQENVVNILANNKRRTINLNKRIPEDELTYN